MTRVPATLRRIAAPLVAVVAASAIVPTVAVAPAGAQTPPPLLAGLVVEGRGYGHGIGLSQYGAFGWSVDYGWDWTQILAHYYGGTALSDVGPGDFVGTPRAT